MNFEERATLILEEQRILIDKLTPYGFSAKFDVEVGQRKSGILRIGHDAIDVQFRVRDLSGDEAEPVAACSFVDLSIQNQDLVRKFLADQQRGFSGNTALESRSYDELAAGEIDEPGEQASTLAADAPATRNVSAPARSGTKSLAMMLMMLAMVALVILAAFFLRSRSTLSIGNSALVGNYLPINAKVEGEVLEVMVVDGQTVQAGDVLMKLSNPQVLMEIENLDAQWGTSVAKVKSLKKQMQNYQAKLEVVGQKLELDEEVAQSELFTAEKTLEVAEATLKRLRPFVQRGSVTQAEFDIAEKEVLAAESMCTAARNQLKLVEFAKQAATRDIVIMGDRLDDEMGRLTAEIEMAQAEQRELEIAKSVAERQVSELEITAPRDGQVYVTYRQVGEFVKVADEVLALSFEGKVWAAGQVTSGQASRVRPGQPVRVKVPSSGQNFDGVVMAVGHRAMYSRGGYTADFRGTTATDVPVKVQINDLPENIPSGIRLEMAINTGFGIEWLDKTMGYELKPVVDQLPSSPTATVQKNASRYQPVSESSTGALMASQK